MEGYRQCRECGPAKGAATREKGAEDRDQGKVQTTERKPMPPFQDSKFARLFVILRFENEVRAASDGNEQVKEKRPTKQRSRVKGFMAC